MGLERRVTKADVQALQGRDSAAQGDVGQAGGFQQRKRRGLQPPSGVSRHLRPEASHPQGGSQHRRAHQGHLHEDRGYRHHPWLKFCRNLRAFRSAK